MFSIFGKFSSCGRWFVWIAICELAGILGDQLFTAQALAQGQNTDLSNLIEQSGGCWSLNVLSLEVRSLDDYKYRVTEVCGWQVKIRDELELDPQSTEQVEDAISQLREQLEEIERVVPKPAVQKLKSVVLWFSPEYDGVPPRAEYHPGAEWLKDNHRDPQMVRGVEFTNVKVFSRERLRMPNFVLHELAHAFHHQVLADGFENKQVKEMYQKARDAGSYENVEQRFGDGRSKTVRAYAMNNAAEYFAEGTEAYFSTNDFFPFDRSQLRKHDPELQELLGQLWSKGAE